MKSIEGLFASFLVVLFVFPVLAFSREAPVQGRDRQTVIGIEHEWLRALIGHDRAALDKILADDFVDSNWKGELHAKNQVLEGLAAARPYSQDLQDIKVRLYGSMAIACGLNEIRGKDSQILMRIRFTDVFVYRHGNWQAVTAQETPVSSP